MEIKNIIPFFEFTIHSLTKKTNKNIDKSTDNTNKFRIKNYKYWLDLLQKISDSNDTTNQQITLDNVDSFAFPPKMKEKITEILTSSTINGDHVDIQHISPPANMTNTIDTTIVHNTDVDVDVSIEDIYGFGPATTKKFVDEYGATGADLLREWSAYTALNPDNHILILHKRSRPFHISQAKWASSTTQWQNAKLKDDIFADLKLHTKYLHHLNYHQLIGVKHYYNIMKKIPRDEMTKIEKILKNILHKLNPEITLTICGSYRRGRATSGDIDCLITHPSITSEMSNDNLLSRIVEILTKLDFLVDHLTEDGTTKYMGLCKLPTLDATPRRIDIRLIPAPSYHYATLYFTGSKNNNTTMRNVAKKMGYKLNEYGMHSITDQTFITANCEEDIFKFLKLPYKTPQERDI